MNRLLITTLVAGSTALLCAGGCGDDEDENGTGGAAGIAGTYGVGGAAGVAGSAGRGGAAGTGTGGSAGSGGAAGTMGSGGAAGTAGTGGAGTGGTGGSAGTAGTSADAGPSAEVVTCPASGTTDIAAAGPPFAFAPVTANVAVGGVAKFTSTSASPIVHTATSGSGGVTPVPDGAWDTGDIAAGAAVCVRFNVAGSYPYYCKYHSVMMTGTITVP